MTIMRCLTKAATRVAALVALAIPVLPSVGGAPIVAQEAADADRRVVAQSLAGIDQALMSAPETADGGDTQALGQSTDRTTHATGAHPRDPKVPPWQ